MLTQFLNIGGKQRVVAGIDVSPTESDTAIRSDTNKSDGITRFSGKMCNELKFAILIEGEFSAGCGPMRTVWSGEYSIARTSAEPLGYVIKDGEMEPIEAGDPIERAQPDESVRSLGDRENLIAWDPIFHIPTVDDVVAVVRDRRFT